MHDDSFISKIPESQWLELFWDVYVYVLREWSEDALEVFQLQLEQELKGKAKRVPLRYRWWCAVAILHRERHRLDEEKMAEQAWNKQITQFHRLVNEPVSVIDKWESWLQRGKQLWAFSAEVEEQRLSPRYLAQLQGEAKEKCVTTKMVEQMLPHVITIFNRAIPAIWEPEFQGEWTFIQQSWLGGPWRFQKKKSAELAAILFLEEWQWKVDQEWLPLFLEFTEADRENTKVLLEGYWMGAFQSLLCEEPEDAMVRRQMEEQEKQMKDCFHRGFDAIWDLVLETKKKGDSPSFPLCFYHKCHTRT